LYKRSKKNDLSFASSTLEGGFMAHLASQCGEKCVSLSSNISYDQTRISTGLFSLDYAIGGGLALHGVTVIFGPESGGKTTLALQAAGAMHHTCMRCFRHTALCQCEEGPFLQSTFYVGLEGDYDSQWALNQGIDPERFVVFVPPSAEQALTAARKALEVPNCGLVIVDSLGAVVPASEMTDDSLYSQEPGVQARLIRKFVATLRLALNRQMGLGHPCYVICLNQIRKQVGLLFGDPEVMPGGHALRHMGTLTLRSQQLAMNKELCDRYTVDGEVVATRHGFKVVKWKFPILRRAGEYIRASASIPELQLKTGQIKEKNTLLKLGLDLDVIRKNKASYSIPGISGKKLKKRAAIKAAWEERPELLWLATQEMVKVQMQRGGFIA
jgi:recombination protein RecA